MHHLITYQDHALVSLDNTFQILINPQFWHFHKSVHLNVSELVGSIWSVSLHWLLPSLWLAVSASCTIEKQDKSYPFHMYTLPSNIVLHDFDWNGTQGLFLPSSPKPSGTGTHYPWKWWRPPPLTLSCQGYQTEQLPTISLPPPHPPATPPSWFFKYISPPVSPD